MQEHAFAFFDRKHVKKAVVGIENYLIQED